MLGNTLDGRYTILRQLGQGGMGAVYEARHAGTGRRVAVKIILGAGAHEEELVARFEREARAVGAVESDHIAQVFDTGRDRATGAPYIAMEYLDGEDVQHILDRLGPLPVDLSLRIALQACLGLERAHEAGVIHRDIKPANLFLTRKENGQRVVKLLDFGVAKIAVTGATDHGLTKTGAMMGSPLYMSPEQARGAGNIDARSDLWSLGVSLFQCISGQRPNDHLTGLGELLVAIFTTPAPWLQSVAPWVPAEVAEIVRRALSIDPAGRYANANELANALKALLPYGYSIVDPMIVPLGATTRSYVAPAGPALAVAPPSARASAPRLELSTGVPPTAFGTTGPEPRTSIPSPRRSVGLIAGGAAAVVLVGSAAAYLALQHRAPAVAPVASASTDDAPPPAPPSATAPPVIAPSTNAPSANAPSATAPSALAPSATPPATVAPHIEPPPGKRPHAPVAHPTPPTPPPKKVTSDDETSRK